MNFAPVVCVICIKSQKSSKITSIRYHVTGDLIYWAQKLCLEVNILIFRDYFNNNSYPNEDYSRWRYSGDRWMEILWTKMRVRGEECPSLRVPRGSFKKVEMKLWCGLFGLSVTDSNDSLMIYEKQMNCPCQPCKHNPALELIQLVNISCRVDVIK